MPGGGRIGTSMMGSAPGEVQTYRVNSVIHRPAPAFTFRMRFITSLAKS